MFKKSLMLAATMMLGASLANASGNWTFGLNGGAAIPTGDYSGNSSSSGFAAGPSGGVFADWHLNSQWALGGDMDYNRNNGKDLPAGTDANTTIMQFGTHAKWNAPTASSFRPYLMGGVGMYNLRASATVGGVSADATQNKLGINGGVGAGVWSNSQMSLSLGGTFHNVFTDNQSLQYFNLGLGLTFATAAP